MGLSGILFQVGQPGDLGEQEGLEETDLLEIVYDRLLKMADCAGDVEPIVQAMMSIQAAIRNIRKFEHIRPALGNDSEY